MLVYWNGLKTPKGSVSDELTHVMDILPTLLDLTDTPYPTTYQGHTIKTLDGHSLLPVLLGQKRSGYAQLFFEHEGGKALIEGDWKLVAPKKKPGSYTILKPTVRKLPT